MRRRMRIIRESDGEMEAAMKMGKVILSPFISL